MDKINHLDQTKYVCFFENVCFFEATALSSLYLFKNFLAKVSYLPETQPGAGGPTEKIRQCLKLKVHVMKPYKV